MKILHVESGRHLYGGALQVFYLLRELSSKDISNILICPQGSDIACEASQYADVDACEIKGDLDFLFTLRLIQRIKKHKPDLIHIHSRRGADVWGALAAKITGTPAILTRRVDNREPSWFAQAKARCYRQVVAISEGIRRVQLEEGVPPSHVKTIHSAVDMEKFSPGRNRETLKIRYGYANDDIVVAVIAQLIRRKGHDKLFSILPRLRQEFPQLRLLVLGKGPLEDELKTLSKSLGINDIVQFGGFQSDINNIIPHVDVIAHPALIEGLGVALLQASACEVPIVATRTGGIPEIVQHEVNGLLCEPGDTDTLYSAMRRMIAEPELRKTLSRNGRLIVNEYFSISKMALQNYQLYQHVLDTEKAASRIAS